MLCLVMVLFYFPETGRHCEMSSFPETKVEKFTNSKNAAKFVQYPSRCW